MKYSRAVSSSFCSALLKRLKRSMEDAMFCPLVSAAQMSQIEYILFMLFSGVLQGPKFDMKS